MCKEWPTLYKVYSTADFIIYDPFSLKVMPNAISRNVPDAVPRIVSTIVSKAVPKIVSTIVFKALPKKLCPMCCRPLKPEGCVAVV